MKQHMILSEYKRKRRFGATPEPRGEVHASKGNLLFVVQKHKARRLHYDFRLELGGVLKSWAVPKGPSLDPAEKRLAMHVEDHPLEYAVFEGQIPKGNYGAGSVIVWDAGTYHPSKTPSKKDEDTLKKQYEAGRMKFFLNGKKLKGFFSLFRIASREGDGKDTWLLVKSDDAFASSEDILSKNTSVLSSKRL